METQRNSKTSITLGIVAALSLAGAITAPPALAASEIHTRAPISQTGLPKQASDQVKSRIAGADRIATAQEIAKRACAQGCETVYFANAYAPADALSIAGRYLPHPGALLLVDPGAPAATLQAQGATARALGAKQVVIVGGPGVLSKEVGAELAGNLPIIRLGGANRQETAVQIAQEAYPEGAQTVVIVAGGTGRQVPPDAVVAATIKAGPVLLARPDGGLDAAAAELVAKLAPTKIIIVGGPGAVNPQVDKQLVAAVPGVAIQRLAGKDRLETAFHVANQVSPGPFQNLYAVNASNPIDALGAATIPGAVIVMLKPGEAVNAYVTQLAGRASGTVIALGGPGAPGMAYRPLGYYPPLDGARRLGVRYHGQQTGYWCGPAALESALEAMGATHAAGTGAPLSQRLLASAGYAATDPYHNSPGGFGTNWFDSSLARGLNNWLGRQVYVQMDKPTPEQFRAAIISSINTGHPVVVKSMEFANGPHYNGHFGARWSHIMVVDGYNPDGDIAYFIDPGHSLPGYSKQPEFTYPAGAFATDFLQVYGMVYDPTPAP